MTRAPTDAGHWEARLSAGSAASCEIDEKLGPLRCVGDQLDFPVG